MVLHSTKQAILAEDVGHKELLQSCMEKDCALNMAISLVEFGIEEFGYILNVINLFSLYLSDLVHSEGKEEVWEPPCFDHCH